MTDSATVPHRFRGLPVRALRVEVVKGPDNGKRHLATSDTITIGTAPGNDLVLTDGTVSRYHVEVRRLEDRIVVQDHGSTNGTALGSALIERASVGPGTILTLGKTNIRIDDGGETVDIELHDDDHLGRVRGRTPGMRRLMAGLRRAAESDAPVLLLGETGTGKEVLAHSIHESSPRSDKPFETVDCGSLMPTLIASELFGHEKGAFTGADRKHVGAFERADGGTLFLDEIGELPMALQPTLLGALERRSFRRVGGNTPISVNVRVVCATNRDLRVEVNSGTFREDLYYRIAVVLMRIPPLRERTGDIPLLVEHFLKEAGYEGSIDEVVPPNAMQALKSYRWPGNVRELRNFVEAALAMGEAPELEMSPAAARGSGGTPSSAPASTSADSERSTAGAPRPGPGPAGYLSVPTDDIISRPYRMAREAVLLAFETLYLNDLMKRTKGNVSLAAREAKMDRTYLIQLLKRHGIK